MVRRSRSWALMVRSLPSGLMVAISPSGPTNTPDLLVGYPDWQPITGAGTGNADTVTADTGTRGTGNASGTGAGQGNGDRTAIPDTTSGRSLPETGGLALLAPAIGLLLISRAVAQLVVRPR